MIWHEGQWLKGCSTKIKATKKFRRFSKKIPAIGKNYTFANLKLIDGKLDRKWK